MNQLEMEQCSRKVASGRFAGTIRRSLVNARDLQLECAKVLHKTLLIPVLMYGNENVIEGKGEI